MDGFETIMDEPGAGDFRAGHLQRRTKANTTNIGHTQRKLSRPSVDDLQFKAGRLIVHIVEGWLKIELLCPDQDSEAELLTPEISSELRNWLCGSV